MIGLIGPYFKVPLRIIPFPAQSLGRTHVHHLNYLFGGCSAHIDPWPSPGVKYLYQFPVAV